LLFLARRDIASLSGETLLPHSGETLLLLAERHCFS